MVCTRVRALLVWPLYVITMYFLGVIYGFMKVPRCHGMYCKRCNNITVHAPEEFMQMHKSVSMRELLQEAMFMCFQFMKILKSFDGVYVCTHMHSVCVCVAEYILMHRFSIRGRITYSKRPLLSAFSS